MDILELNLDTMTKLADTLRQKGGTFSQFDGIIYELIEAGLFEAESGNFGRAVWNGDEIADCDDCQEPSADLNYLGDSGLVMCPSCYGEAVN